MTLNIAGIQFGPWKAVEPTGTRSPKGSFLWRFACVHCGKGIVRAGSQVKSDAAHGRLGKCRCQEVDSRRQQSAARRGRMYARFVAGATYAQIGAEFGVTKQRAEQIVNAVSPPGDIRELVSRAERGELEAAVFRVVPKRHLLRLAIALKETSDGIADSV